MPDLAKFIEAKIPEGRKAKVWDYKETVATGTNGKWARFPKSTGKAVVSIAFPGGSGEATIETCHNTYKELKNGIDDMVLEWEKGTVDQTALGPRDTVVEDELTSIPTAIRLVNISGNAKYTVRAS